MELDAGLFLQVADAAGEVAGLWIAARAEHAGDFGSMPVASPSFSKPTVALM